MRSLHVPELARVASMIGEPARAAILEALLGGQALPAGELARRARVAPATASAHLTRLVEGGLLTRTCSGRHRYFALASAEVADVLEALALVGSARGGAPVAEAAPNGSLRFARTCYDHLAGILGVRITERLVEQRYIVGREGYELTPAGDAWLGSLGVDVDAVRSARRVVARPCLDWTERRPHLAGGAGAAIAGVLFERRWLTRLDGTRAVRLTLRGREGLARTLGVEFAAG
jgi:DNA-binding transcriptional ArsR family regulator